MTDLLPLLGGSFLFGLVAAGSALTLELIFLFVNRKRRQILMRRLHEKGPNQVIKESLGLVNTRKRKAA